MIVFDLDETLRDNTGSAPYAPKEGHDWTNWQHWVNNNGTVIDRIAELYTQLSVNQVEMVILTSSRFGTKEWLERNGLPLPDCIIERQPGDYRHPHDMKKDWIHNQAPTLTLWVDDDIEMLNYVEAMGTPVVRVVW